MFVIINQEGAVLYKTLSRAEAEAVLPSLQYERGEFLYIELA